MAEPADYPPFQLGKPRFEQVRAAAGGGGGHTERGGGSRPFAARGIDPPSWARSPPLRFAPPPAQSRTLIGPQPPRYWSAGLSLRAAAPCPRRVARRAGSSGSQCAPVARGAARRAGGSGVAGSSPAGAPRDNGDRQGPGVAPGVAWRGFLLSPRGWCEGMGSAQGGWEGKSSFGLGMRLPGAQGERQGCSRWALANLSRQGLPLVTIEGWIVTT